MSQIAVVALGGNAGEGRLSGVVAMVTHARIVAVARSMPALPSAPRTEVA